MCKMSLKLPFFPIRWFGRIDRSFGRTVSADFDRSFGFGRTLLKLVSIVYGTSIAISAKDASYKEFSLLPIQIDLALLDNYG